MTMAHAQEAGVAAREFTPLPDSFFVLVAGLAAAFALAIQLARWLG